MTLPVCATITPQIDQSAPCPPHSDFSPSKTSPPLTTDHMLVGAHLHELGMGSFGVVATEPIAAGTPCVMFGGFITHEHDFRQLSDYRQRHSFQVGEDLFMVCGEEPGLGDFVNHSCDPTMVCAGEITMAARRDIAAGEELTFDYSTADSKPYDEFECECEAAQCRGKVTGEDWMRDDLQQRYAGNFAPYLQRRINALRAE